jgi:predicted CxxxxCH...CXXCH cytochrome family protein
MHVGVRAGSVLIASVALVSCNGEPIEPVLDGCRSCHGSTRGAAPPRALDGTTDPSSPGVGAHDAHLFGTRLMRPVACGECHVEVATVDAPGHLDDSPGAEITFGVLATRETSAEWRAADRTCAGTYCHGATLSGGGHRTPIWNVTDGSQVACDGCHAMPPPAPHPSGDDCQLCHAPVAGPAQTLGIPQRHIDGTVDVRDLGQCFGCHGNKTNLAPPIDLAMESSTDRVSVGAHQTHIDGGLSSRPVECASCHVVPQMLEDEGHIDRMDGAEVRFSGIASSDGASPAWDHQAATCAGAYCHGATMGIDAPAQWTIVDGTEAKCGSCHALPPPAPHPASDRCEMCHLPTAGPSQTIANRDTHVDGALQVNENCAGCHGTGENLAPPIDTSGAAETTARSVGAHQIHVLGGRLSRPVACDTCHVVPKQVDESGHIDGSLPAEVRMIGLASAHGAQPEWIADMATCANTYCHGSGTSGGTNTDPTWTVVSGTEAACGACHGLPPPAPHPANDRCVLCHAPTAGPDRTIANPMTHVDGIVQASDGTCADCHGGGEIAAPPLDTMGRSDPVLPTVGAHRSHVGAGTGIARPTACDECHVVPLATDDPGHIDTDLPAELSWGARASQGTVPIYDLGSATCANYCHGATLADGVLTVPSWTTVDGSQAACGSCHGVPPGAPHPQDDRCELCHLPSAGLAMTIADPTTHVDGVLQVAGGCDSCHGENGVSAPPLDLDGSSDTSIRTVGAHRIHLAGGAFGKPVECGECHVVPAEVGSPGHVDTLRPAEITFGAIAAFGSIPTYDGVGCSDTYCHGGVGATTPIPRWTQLDGTQAACGGCHGVPPSTPSHQGAGDCAICHLPTAGPNLTIANRTTHVDGVLQVTSLDCTTCHGDMTSSAPPLDLLGGTDPTDPEVGAHRAHLSGGSFSAAVPCSSCHLVPIDSNDPGHLDTPAPAEIAFSGRASSALAAPVFDPAARRCSDTYCHGAASTLGTDPEPIWNAAQPAACGSCHGLPPGGSHPQLDACEVCHAPVAGANQTIANRMRHVDGVVDVDDNLACEACHGSPASPAPPMDLAGLAVSPRVGAHQVHLSGTPRSLAVPCSECHVPVSPTNLDQAGHYDTDRPAEVIFGALARTAGANPSRAGGNCNNTYCHGSTLLGGTETSPAWTAGAQACSACHGMPPPDANHGGGTATQCEGCHPDTVGPGQAIVDRTKHVNGVIDTSAACDACHGQNGDSAPPRDLAGLTVSDQVGAHQAHVSPALSAAVACGSCHRVPIQYGDAGHADTPAPAEVNLIGRAELGGLDATYAGLRCTNTYCHGATLPEGATAVDWNDADGSESQCGACHGMPPSSPAHAGQGPISCHSCHQDVAGMNATIVTPSLHIDGIVEVSGGGCDTCHASPPSPGNESYAGSAGAHAQHTATLGMDCAQCHGNNGAGATHNEGNGTVSRNNVDLVFAPITYPGGTVMGSATYTAASMTCAVGCHNPRVGNPAEAQNLQNTIGWGAGNVTCRGCHDSVQATAPRSHDIAALGDAGCLTCHAQVGHTLGTAAIADPDPADGFVFGATNLDGLCKTCHDGGAGTFFGGQTPPNVSPYWTTSSHGAQNIRCTECHTYHASAGGPLFIDRASASCMVSGCHDNLTATFNQVAGGPRSHHRIEGGPGIQVACIDCHNPHLSQAPPLAAVNPDDIWALYSIPVNAGYWKISDGGDYRGFCLKCHDGAPPAGVSGAPNIAVALANGLQDPTGFRKVGNEGLHRKAHNKWNCQSCHDEHGSPGNSLLPQPGGRPYNGNVINRGRMLLDYMTIVDDAQQEGYSATLNMYHEKKGCSTGRLACEFDPTKECVPGYGFKCH